MDRSIDDMMACFEFACLKTKNGLMSRFFFEPWETKLYSKAKKLFNLLNYLHKKMYNTKDGPDGRRLSITEAVETDAYRLKKNIEFKIEEVQYHNISYHQARTLYECYDDQNRFWS